MQMRRGVWLAAGLVLTASAAWSYAQHETPIPAAATEAGRYTVLATNQHTLLVDTATGESWRLSSSSSHGSDVVWLPIPRVAESHVRADEHREHPSVLTESKCGFFFAPLTKVITPPHLVEGDYEPVRARVELEPIPDDLELQQPQLAEPITQPKY